MSGGIERVARCGICNRMEKTVWEKATKTEIPPFNWTRLIAILTKDLADSREGIVQQSARFFQHREIDNLLCPKCSEPIFEAVLKAIETREKEIENGDV